MSDKVMLIVKAANQSFIDQRIECSLDWSGQKLKEEISKTHPAKPTVQDQRLIYSGQLLQDTVSLKNTLRHPSENNEYIIHLVCSFTKTNTKPKSPTTQPYSQPVPVATPPAPVASESTSYSAASSDVTSDGVRRRIVTPSEQPTLPRVQQPELDTASSSQPPQMLFPFSPVDPAQQMAVMQQMYAQYMASYMQYLQTGSVDGGSFFQDQPLSAAVSAPPQSVSPAAVFPPETEDSRTNVPPQPQAPNNANEQEAQREPQIRANPQVGVGGDDDEDGVARDWLDYIYFGSRMIVLLSIVYFYSTLVRFLVVACATIFIYLYQCGFLRLWRVEDPPQPARDDPQTPPVDQGVEDDGAGPHPNAPSSSPPPTAADEEQAGNAAASSREALQEEGGEHETALPPPLEGAASRAEVEEGVQNAGEGQQPPQPPSSSSSSSSRNPLMEALPPQPSLLALSWTFVTTFFTSLIPDQHQIVV